MDEYVNWFKQKEKKRKEKRIRQMSIIVFTGHPSQVYIYCHRCCLEYSSQAIGRSESWGGADVLAKLAGVIVGSLTDGEPHLHSALEEIFVKGA